MPRANVELCRKISQPQRDIIELIKIRLSKLRLRLRWDITGARFELEIDSDSESDETCTEVESIGFAMHWDDFTTQAEHKLFPVEIQVLMLRLRARPRRLGTPEKNSSKDPERSSKAWALSVPTVPCSCCVHS